MIIQNKDDKSSKQIVPTNNRRKSKFKKCPNAPKRFKSAYIFFSTDMMQKIKAQQKGSAEEKQKITDISKRISTAWKNLGQDERAKWNLIAKKDKERFLEEKRNYKGPWQLPVKQGLVQSHQSATHESNIPTYAEPSKERYCRNIMNSDSTMDTHKKAGNTKLSHSELAFDQVSQEERDAAHDLLSLHMQSRGRSRSNSSNSVSTSANTQSSVVSADSDNDVPYNRYASNNGIQNSRWSDIHHTPFGKFQHKQPSVFQATSATFNTMYNTGTYPPTNMIRSDILQKHSTARYKQVMNPAFAIGRTNRFLPHSQYPPNRFNFAQF